MHAENRIHSEIEIVVATLHSSDAICRAHCYVRKVTLLRNTTALIIIAEANIVVYSRSG